MRPVGAVGDHGVVPPPPDLHPVCLSLREPGPYAHRPHLLDEHPFWWGHLSACLRGRVPRSWLGQHDPAATRDFDRRLWSAGDRLGVAQPGRLAAFMLRRQGMAGPARWSTDAHGVQVNDGRHSFRNPQNRDALPDCRMAQLSASLDPAHPPAVGGVCPAEGPPDNCPAEPPSTTACPRRVTYTRWLATLLPDSSPPF